MVTQPRELGRKRLKLAKLRIVGFGAVADLVDMSFEGTFLGRILGSHRLEPFCKYLAYCKARIVLHDVLSYSSGLVGMLVIILAPRPSK